MRAFLYDVAISKMTTEWYRHVLERLPVGAYMLDVGVGTGAPLVANAAQLISKDIVVYGVDTDKAYIRRCQKALISAELADRIHVSCESIYQHYGGPYDAIYFGGSFMVLANPLGALHHVLSLLKPDGRVYFTQTFEARRRPLLECLKPFIKTVTTIDFGRVSYEDTFHKLLAEAGFIAIENDEIKRDGSRSSRCIVARRMK